jgi:uncharacterized protein (DUF362 family)
VPVYSRDDDRSVTALQELYRDTDRLTEVIRSLVARHVACDSLENKRVLLKPNWVTHSTRATDEICLRTNDAFLIAALRVVASQKPSRIVIGDAPIQGCKWHEVVTSALSKSIDALAKEFGVSIAIKDFRRRTFQPSLNNPISDRNPLTNYVIYDLGRDSLLEPITRFDRNMFRVTDYDPDRLAESHRPGVHKYCITKEIFKADVIISLPKIKTHQKAGITAALKNLVGLNGDKDFLPHHRIGGDAVGGDCYPGKNVLRYWSELALDYANRNQGRMRYRLGSCVSRVLWKLSNPSNYHHLAAGWYGNDPTWRMVMDLNAIAVYGSADGKIMEAPQRQLLSLSDGIVAGQGDGPLDPLPHPLGVIALSNDSAAHDTTLAILMNFDPDKIPLLKYARSNRNDQDTELLWDGKPVTLDDLKKEGVDTIPPPGWLGILS